MAVPAVVRFGYGFVQGADDAAAELGVQTEIKFWFCDSFSPSDDIKTKMNGWYTEGTEVVFSCGGGIYLSAVAAANEAGAKVIGVDTDQGHMDPCIITSAMKDLTNSVKAVLTDLYNNGIVWPWDPWPDRYPGRGGRLRGPAHRREGLALQRLHRGGVQRSVEGEERRDRNLQRHRRGPEVTNSTVDYQN